MKTFSGRFLVSARLFLLPVMVALGILALPRTGCARLEGYFGSLAEMIADSDYIVIVTVDEGPRLPMMDGWEEYDCRFVYWLKAGTQGPVTAALQLQKDEKETKPVPLHSFAQGKPESFPPKAPHNHKVILVDEHEKPYHRLAPSGLDRSQLVMKGRMPHYQHYQLLFLKKDEEGKGYITVGCYQSILPVSPLLDVSKLPPEPHEQYVELASAQSKVTMGLEETVRFIVKDYIAYKEKELGEIRKDLDEVVREKK